MGMGNKAMLAVENMDFVDGFVGHRIRKRTLASIDGRGRCGGAQSRTNRAG